MTTEAVKQLNRLVNDREIPHRARREIAAAVKYIEELEARIAKALEVVEEIKEENHA